MNTYHFKVVARVREDLSEGQRAFIEKEMALWQEKFKLEREGEAYYKAGEVRGLDDFGAVTVFYCKLKKRKEYFKALEYHDLWEGEKQVAV